MNLCREACNPIKRGGKLDKPKHNENFNLFLSYLFHNVLIRKWSFIEASLKQEFHVRTIYSSHLWKTARIGRVRLASDPYNGDVPRSLKLRNLGRRHGCFRQVSEPVSDDWVETIKTHDSYELLMIRLVCIRMIALYQAKVSNLLKIIQPY